MELVLERKRQPDRTVRAGLIEVTPPIEEDYWRYRVSVGNNAIVGFPKFGTVGIGFQREEDWNTNLPYTSSAEVIYEHIKHNKDCRATRETCLQAIRLIQEAVRQDGI